MPSVDEDVPTRHDRRTPRKLLAYAIYLVAAVFLLGGLAKGLTAKSVERTIANSEKIDVVFRSARAFVDEWTRTNGHTPSKQTYDAWASTQPDAGKYLSVGSLRYWNEDMHEDMFEEIGAPPPGSYVLSYWRGEWTEYCAGWSGKTSLALRKSDFYWLGSAAKDLLASALIFLGLILIGRRIG